MAETLQLQINELTNRIDTTINLILMRNCDESYKQRKVGPGWQGGGRGTEGGRSN
jgi:hypothetical protein